LRNTNRSWLHHKAAGRRWPPGKARLERLIAEAIVDAYGEDEQRAGFFTLIEGRLALPFEAEVLGVTVTVEAEWIEAYRRWARGA
jgi:hypothetical protein